jgi:hypothetical protein
MSFPAAVAESTVEQRRVDLVRRYPHLSLAFEPSNEYLPKSA